MSFSWMDSLSTSLLRCSSRLATAERLEWAQAMSAELPHAATSSERLRWSVSCSLLHFRQWFTQLLKNSPQTLFEGWHMKRSVVAILLACAALFGGLVCVPEFREGLTIGREFVLNATARSGNRYDAELARLAQRAESEHNAKLLAYVALRSTGDTAVRRARRAVETDKTLTWIYGPVCSDYRATMTAECSTMIQQLEAWDTENAVPWLLEAHRIARTLDPNYRSSGIAPKDGRWHSVMANAFATPIYDSYRRRVSQLTLDVYATQHELDLVTYTEGLVRNDRIPDFSQAQAYAREVLSTEPQSVVNFARRVNAGAQTSLEQLFASSMLDEGYKQQNALRPGAVSSLQIAADTNQHGGAWSNESTFFPFLDPLSTSFQLAIVMQVVCSSGLLFLLISSAWQWATRRAVGRHTQTLLALSAELFAAASLVMLFVYHPFSMLAHSFPIDPHAANSLAPWMFVTLYHPFVWNGAGISLWSFVLAVCGIAMAVVLSRMLVERRSQRLKPA